MSFFLQQTHSQQSLPNSEDIFDHSSILSVEFSGYLIEIAQLEMFSFSNLLKKNSKYSQFIGANTQATLAGMSTVPMRATCNNKISKILR